MAERDASTQAPEDSAAVAVQLFLAHAPQGSVWWDDIRFERVPTPAPRLVTIASVNLRPESTGSSEKSVEQFMETADASFLPTPILSFCPKESR